MKSKLSLLPVLLLLLIAFSCSEEEPSKKDPGEETIVPDVLDLPIVSGLSVASIDPKDTLKLTLAEKPGRVTIINSIPYRAVIDQVEITGGYVITSGLSKDSTVLHIIPEEVLPGSKSLTVKVAAHWEWKIKGSWETITWEEAVVGENFESSFTTSFGSFSFSSDELEYTYPIANQYNFLMDESDEGFIKLKRANSHVFAVDNYEFKVQFLNDLNLIIERDVTYTNSNKTITFEIPDNLEHQMIYNFRLFARNITTLEETEMVQFHFRTSKYKNFTEKFNSIVYNGNVFSILVEPWRGHYLSQYFTSVGEYFDDFETGVGYVPVTIGNHAHQVPYANNLIRFKATIQGTPWYDDSLYPWLYAPWTDQNFKPTINRSTTEVGSPPLEAMSLLASGSGRLTPAMIENNSAPPITKGSYPSISFNLALIIWQDFLTIQAQAVDKYIYVEVLPKRENDILFNSMPPVSAGTYKYKVNYTLPNGVITTSLDKSMTY